MKWEKLLSGRFWLSLIAGITFAYCAYADKLPPEALAAICVMVFQAYFSRKRDE